MSNGHACCFLGVCCPPGDNQAAQQIDALALVLNEKLGLSIQQADGVTGLGHTVAEWILTNYDLVPKGVGLAIVEGYRPFALKGAFKKG